jgi:hypothetical protein
MNTLNNGNGPVLAPEDRDNGALVKNGLSFTVRNTEEVVELSAFKKTVPFEVFVSVASNVTVAPAVPERVTCVRVISMESAQASPDNTSTDIAATSR